MSEEQADKQFEPTEQRLRKAREKGDIPRSTELNAALMYGGTIISLAAATGVLLPRWLAEARKVAGENITMLNAKNLAQMSSLIVLVLVAIPAVLILLGLIVQRGLTFSPQKLGFDISRINPIKNAGQKFGKTGLVTFGISTAKAAVVAVAGWMLFNQLIDLLIQQSRVDGWGWTAGLEIVLRQAILVGLVASILFTAFDLAWKHYDYRERNRMSRKELQDEIKDSEGDPHVKSARRQKAVEIAMNSMLADVEGADVVIVNPTHYAVALEWKRGSGQAPICVAKGVDDVAARIRERARDHDIPIWSDPPCARALYAQIDIGEEIEREHFAAVATAIRFAERMREKARQGW